MTERTAFPWWRFLAPHHWPTWVVLGLLRMTIMLPFGARLSVGRTLGRLTRILWRDRRRAAEVNLELCLPELDGPQQARLVRDHFEALGIGAIEVGMCWWGEEAELRELVTARGLEHLERVRADGVPVILLSAHFTTLEIGGRLLSLFTPFHLMYRPSRLPLLEEVIRRNRERHFEKAIARDSVKAMLISLREGMPVWYAPDQNYRHKGSIAAPFFGRMASTNTATARLAKVTGAKVIPYFVKRLPGTAGYEIELGAPLADFPSDDIATDTARVNAALEAMIRRAPEQYLWIHKRFKRRTKRRPDLPDPYDP